MRLEDTTWCKTPHNTTSPAKRLGFQTRTGGLRIQKQSAYALCRLPATHAFCHHSTSDLLDQSPTRDITPVAFWAYRGRLKGGGTESIAMTASTSGALNMICLKALCTHHFFTAISMIAMGKGMKKHHFFGNVGVPYFWTNPHPAALVGRCTSERQLLSELAIIVRPQLVSATSLQVQQVGSHPHVSIN